MAAISPVLNTCALLPAVFFFVVSKRRACRVGLSASYHSWRMPNSSARKVRTPSHRAKWLAACDSQGQARRVINLISWV